jgi:general secretion pathway protein K
MKKIRRYTQPGKSQSGIALFMVISALAVLSILTTELTYSTQVQSRIANNFIDNLRAYYLAKAGYKLSLIRLKAFLSIKKFASDNKNPIVKQSLNKSILEKIWNMPFVFPIPIPPDASIVDKDKIMAFQKASSFGGSFLAAIDGESSRMNLNNLFVKQAPQQQQNPQNPQTPNPQPTPQATPQAQNPNPTQNVEVNFRSALEPAITQILEQKKEQDLEFAEIYRNVQGRDIVDAIEFYLFRDMPSSNLPGFKSFKPKAAPFYAISELHMIPGFDDGLYDLLAPNFTTNTTPGINVNRATKTTLRGLIYELSDEDADLLMKFRDDPAEGKPWDTKDDFWKSVESLPTAGRSLQDIKDRFTKANLNVVTDEETFHITVQATHGLSTRTLEAYIILNQSSSAKTPGQAGAGSPADPNNPQVVSGMPAKKNKASAMKDSGLKLVYWRVI